MRSRLLRDVVVAVVALAVGSATVVVASGVIGGGGVIQGCYHKNSGALRVVTSASECLNSEVPISWNQQGAQGPQGVPGPSGPPGPAAAFDFGAVAGSVCTLATGEVGTISVSYDSSRRAVFTCDLTSRWLRVTLAGTGPGTVRTSDFSFECSPAAPHACDRQYNAGATVTLTATPSTPTSRFVGWNGACAGTGTCVITMQQDRAVTATFEETGVLVSVSLLGATNGASVYGYAPGYQTSYPCVPSCRLPGGSTVTLRVDFSRYYASFVGWGGACSGTADECTFTLTAPTSVTAEFAVNPSLKVTTSGARGHVQQVGSDTFCSGASGCEFYAPISSTFDLVAITSGDSRFVGWSGACSGSTAECHVVLDGSKTVNAAFAYNVPASMTSASGPYCAVLFCSVTSQWYVSVCVTDAFGASTSLSQQIQLVRTSGTALVYSAPLVASTTPYRAGAWSWGCAQFVIQRRSVSGGGYATGTDTFTATNLTTPSVPVLVVQVPIP